MELKNIIGLTANIIKQQNFCQFSYLCQFCTSCCLSKRLKEKDFEKCYSYQCINSPYCIEAIEGLLSSKDIPKLNSIFRTKYKVKKPFNRFNQSFIPRINISSEKTRSTLIKIIEEQNLDTIAVSLQDLLSEDKNLIIIPSKLEDLHKLLNFEGKILLLTNIKDIYCEKLLVLDNLFKFIDSLKILNPDIITTIDANFYISQPFFITIYQLSRIIEANKYLKDLDIYQIGLIPPLPLKIFKKFLEIMLKIGYKTIGIPLLEINRCRDFSLRRKIMRALNDFKLTYNFEFILISTKPYNKTQIDCFSSHSWITRNTKSLKFQEKIKVWKNNLIKDINMAEKARKSKNIIDYLRRIE